MGFFLFAHFICNAIKLTILGSFVRIKSYNPASLKKIRITFKTGGSLALHEKLLIFKRKNSVKKSGSDAAFAYFFYEKRNILSDKLL